ncbi:hypothetical protein U1Q18_037175 [Sarracenia purpurea var. burkii]
MDSSEQLPRSARTEEGILQTVHYITGGGPAQPQRGINGTVQIAAAANDIYFCDRSNPSDYFWKISVQRFRRRGSGTAIFDQNYSVIRPDPRERESYGEKKLQEILDPVLKAMETVGEEDDSGVFGAGCEGRRDWVAEVTRVRRS